MHELSIAQMLVEQVLNIAQKEGATRILEIEVSIGPLSGIVKECLVFCFPEATRGTLLENTRLSIQEEPLQIYCKDCQKDSFPKLLFLYCPSCGSLQTEIIQGKKFQLKQVEIE